ncbi:NAD(P)/FAD-dependent oxidoreductase [Parapusillimonas sp. SGNA-6]|uniref:NAD(P)/FAD-dependent oxidoreductase n=1 Tax=Parapedobacter sp. SGR-10 TaxID=2710879 RepID=UPI0013D449DC|nr:NAD(P)/FAD-dependent oxidoreductase [Parapedobacter sp. SGR-10]NGF57970.1 NAD(P)/FAD-dependent oxidoreductase [Parapedobacter sp. SGR-10]NGM89877.1 NAD(P)/FAD-dependent oxidoreductase [Parapusillimonas sp. SGNA-6]
MEERIDFDVIIVGGSYAGLSAAMALGRSLRHVLIIDSGYPCNRQTPHSHNFISHDGEKPSVIAEKARSQVMAYPTVRFYDGLAVYGKRTDTGYEIGTQGGQTFGAKKLLFATGIKDIMPDITGFQECWGISVIHCPYCHGYEYRGKKTAIMANGERAFHIASLVHNLTDNVTILTRGKADFNTDQIDRLEKHNIQIIETDVVKIAHEQGYVNQVVFRGGSNIHFDAVYAALPFEQHSDIPAKLGCELTDLGHIKVDMSQKTSIEGIFACGDSSSMMRSVAYAVATGNIAGAMINHQLTEEMF